MNIKSGDIYHGRRPLRLILKILAALIITLLILAIVIFFWFRTYIVYTPDGVRLDIPFLDRNVSASPTVD